MCFSRGSMWREKAEEGRRDEVWELFDRDRPPADRPEPVVERREPEPTAETASQPVPAGTAR